MGIALLLSPAIGFGLSRRDEIWADTAGDLYRQAAAAQGEPQTAIDWNAVVDLPPAIEAAEAGQGFALTDQVLATDSLIEGWLVRPFNFDMKDHWHYWIVRGKGQKETVPVRAFREWMMGEITDTNRKFAQLSGQKPPAVAGKAASS